MTPATHTRATYRTFHRYTRVQLERETLQPYKLTLETLANLNLADCNGVETPTSRVTCRSRVNGVSNTACRTDVIVGLVKGGFLSHRDSSSLWWRLPSLVSRQPERQT